MGLFDTYCVLGIALFLPKNKDWGVPGSAQDQKGVDSCNLYKSCAVTGHVQHTVLAEDNNTSAAPLCPQTPPSVGGEKNSAVSVPSLFKTVSGWYVVGRK